MVSRVSLDNRINCIYMYIYIERETEREREKERDIDKQALRVLPKGEN